MIDWQDLVARRGDGRVTVADGWLRADRAQVLVPPAATDEAAEALVGALAELARALAGARRVGDRGEAVRAYLFRPGGWWARVLARAGLERFDEDRWAGDAGALALERGELVFGRRAAGWVTPYSWAQDVRAVARLPLAALPDDEAGAVGAIGLLLRCAALAAAPDAPGGGPDAGDPNAVH